MYVIEISQNFIGRVSGKKSSHEARNVSVRMKKVKQNSKTKPGARETGETKEVVPAEVPKQPRTSLPTSSNFSPKSRVRTNSYTQSQVTPKKSPLRQRSSSFAYAVHSPIKPLEQAFRSKREKSGSNSSIESSSSESYAPHTSNYSYTTSTANPHKLSEQSTNDLIFDYIHGEIKHKPKTAFGSVVHDDTSSTNSPKTSKKGGTDTHMNGDAVEDLDVDEETELIAADDFLNQCIVESELTVITPAEKPHSSATFDRILKEFMPDHSSDSECSQSHQLFRPRAFSLPINSVLKTNATTPNNSKRVHMQLPEQ